MYYIRYKIPFCSNKYISSFILFFIICFICNTTTATSRVLSLTATTDQLHIKDAIRRSSHLITGHVIFPDVPWWQVFNPRISLHKPVTLTDRGIFNSVAIPTLSPDTKWNRLMRGRMHPFLEEYCSKGIVTTDCSDNIWRPWIKLYRRAAKLSNIERLSYINRRVNQLIRYTSDINNYGISDHWASLSETVRNGTGDCEDYAIAKMALLYALNTPLEQTQLVILRDIERNLDHAVLVVHINGTPYIMDSLISSVKTAKQLPFYQPIYSLSAGKRWIHGIKHNTLLAAQDKTKITPYDTSRNRNNIDLDQITLNNIR